MDIEQLHTLAESMLHRFSDSIDPSLLDLISPGNISTCKSGDMIVSAGEKLESSYLLLEGVVRFFYTTKNGKERNTEFHKEGDFIGSLSSFYTDDPIQFGIEAIEACTLVKIPFELMKQEPNVRDVWDGVARETFIAVERRSAVLLTCDAIERYEWVEQNEPWIIQRVPQYHLASYLRLEPGSLSRIKSSRKSDSLD